MYFTSGLRKKYQNLISVFFFISVPSSSSSEDESEKIVSKTTNYLKTVEPLNVKEKRRFSETIAIEHKERFQEQRLQFAMAKPQQAPPPRKLSKSELIVMQPGVPQGVRKEVQVPGMCHVFKKSSRA